MRHNNDRLADKNVHHSSRFMKKMRNFSKCDGLLHWRFLEFLKRFLNIYFLYLLWKKPNSVPISQESSLSVEAEWNQKGQRENLYLPGHLSNKGSLTTSEVANKCSWVMEGKFFKFVISFYFRQQALNHLYQRVFG